MPVDLTPMQVTQWNLSYQRQFLAQHDVRRHLHGEPDRRTSGPATRRTRRSTSRATARPGQYALTAAGPCSNTTAANRQARSLLTLLNPAEGQYYAANTVAQLYDDARGWYQGVRFGLTEAPRRRLEHQHQLHLQQVHQRRRARRRGGHRQRLSGADRTTSRAAIRGRTPRRTKGRASPIAATTSTCRRCWSAPASAAGSCETLTKDWQTGIIWQARSGSPITPTTTGDFALTGSAAAADDRLGRRSLSRRTTSARGRQPAARRRWRGSTWRRSRRTRRVCGATRRRAICSGPASGTSTRRSRAT